MANNRNTRRERHPILRTTRGIAWLVLLACVVCVGWILKQEQSGKALTQSLREQYHAAMSASAETLDAIPIVVDTPIEDAIQDTFKDLYAQNNDLVGWLTVSENIEEPVLYRDNSFYMNHDFNGNNSAAGAIFLDEANDKTMLQPMLLIYGHNMRSGAMFGDLNQFRDKDYLKNHPIMTLHSIFEETPREYVIISAFDASMQKGSTGYLGIRKFEYATPEDFQAQIDEIKARSYIELPVPVDSNDQLVMLVTCSYSLDDGRFLLVGRRLRDGETAESVTAEYFQ